MATVVYGLANAAASSTSTLADVGKSLVEVSFPFPYFAQPITYLSVASVTFFYTGLRLWQNNVAQWSHLQLASLQLLAIVLAFVSGYEVLYNFMVWGSFASAQILYNTLSTSASLLASPAVTPWDVDFATKIFASFFVISGYSVYFLRKVHQVRGLSDGL